MAAPNTNTPIQQDALQKIGEYLDKGLNSVLNSITELKSQSVAAGDVAAGTPTDLKFSGKSENNAETLGGGKLSKQDVAKMKKEYSLAGGGNGLYAITHTGDCISLHSMKGMLTQTKVTQGVTLATNQVSKSEELKAKNAKRINSMSQNVAATLG